MAKITWLGEGPDGPQENTWAGKTFKVGEAVDIDDLWMIEKAQNNRFYSVTGAPQKQDSLALGQKLNPAPSTVGSQRAVPKPGEPVGSENAPLKKV